MRAWAAGCERHIHIDKFCFHAMAGGSKTRHERRRQTNILRRFKEIIPSVKRMMLFDYDDSKGHFIPTHENPSLAEWKRKNIENYLLVPDAWKRAVSEADWEREIDLFTLPTSNMLSTNFLTGRI